jgi:integrase
MASETPKRVRVERGLYQAGTVYYACATPPGSRSAVWKSLGTVGRMEARRLRDEFVANVRRGERRDSDSRRHRATFAEVADDWLAAQRRLVEVGEMAPRTFDGYELSLRRHVRPWFGQRQIRTVTPNDLVAWYAHQRETGAAAWSIKGRWNALRGVLNHAARHELIQSNPADALTSRERPKPGPSRARFLTEEEMGALLDGAQGRDHVLLAVLLFSGLRISEALGLVWSEVDLRSGHLRIRHQLSRKGKRVRLKTAGAKRDVVVMESLAQVLRKHRLAAAHSRPTDPLFATASGKAVSARNASRALSRVTTKAHIIGVTPHTFRHTYASLLIAQGNDPVFVADQLGHSNPAITLRVYAHLFRAAKQEHLARTALNEAYGGMLRGGS